VTARRAFSSDAIGALSTEASWYSGAQGDGRSATRASGMVGGRFPSGAALSAAYTVSTTARVVGQARQRRRGRRWTAVEETSLGDLPAASTA
jgi:hypothetical protein